MSAIALTAGEPAGIGPDLVVQLACQPRPRRVVAVAPETARLLHEAADASLPLAHVREMFSHLVACVPGELFAAYRAEVIDEPFFRNFEGGRSTEGGGGISRIRSSEVWKNWQS